MYKRQNQTAISHNEAREIVNKYFEELESKMGAVAIEPVSYTHLDVYKRQELGPSYFLSWIETDPHTPYYYCLLYTSNFLHKHTCFLSFCLSYQMLAKSLRKETKYVSMNERIVLFFYSDTRVNRYNGLFCCQERIYRCV